VAAAPSVRKFAREIGIAIREVPGTGPKGRTSIDDVKAYAKQLNEGRAAPTAAGTTGVAPPLPDFSQWGEIKREPMNNVRKMTVQHMSLCWSTIPHVTQHGDADITDLEVLRKRFADRVEEAGGKLTPTAILLKVVASALKAFPTFNASVDTTNNEIVLKKYVNIGVAVDTPKGLVVPVIRDADRKNIIELSVELTQLAQRVRDGKLAPDDMQGGTFTVSNIGGIGGTYFTPIVNYPEVAILGIGRALKQPVYIDDQPVPRLLMPLSLSYDHRLIDGADGARFLRWICEAVQEPLLLALEG
jgi:pyruvate dehydrogenase E2 component (dihydrolipoamide acetyltransferase)